MPAVNATSIDAPHGVSEWAISGLHQALRVTVAPSGVQESVFSTEGKLTDMKDFENRARLGMSIAAVGIVEATRLCVREDAIDEDSSHIDLKVLRLVAQLGDISYARITETFERALLANVSDAGYRLLLSGWSYDQRAGECFYVGC